MILDAKKRAIRNRCKSEEYLMELTIEQALQEGIAAHKEGKLQDAERLYRTILQSQPKHPDANHNLGVLAVSVNKTDGRCHCLKLLSKPIQR